MWLCAAATRSGQARCLPVMCMQVTHRDTVSFVAETTGAALITKGVFVPPGTQVAAGAGQGEETLLCSACLLVFPLPAWACM